MNGSWKIAATRALAGGCALAGLALFTQLAQTTDWQQLLSATGVAFFGFLAWRLGFEGYIDRPKS